MVTARRPPEKFTTAALAAAVVAPVKPKGKIRPQPTPQPTRVRSFRLTAASAASAPSRRKNSFPPARWEIIPSWTGASGRSTTTIPARATTKLPVGPSNKSSPLRRISPSFSPLVFFFRTCRATRPRSGSISIPTTTVCCRKSSKMIERIRPASRGISIGTCPSHVSSGSRKTTSGATSSAVTSLVPASSMRKSAVCSWRSMKPVSPTTPSSSSGVITAGTSVKKKLRGKTRSGTAAPKFP